jgi:hypothetical protein
LYCCDGTALVFLWRFSGTPENALRLRASEEVIVGLFGELIDFQIPVDKVKEEESLNADDQLFVSQQAIQLRHVHAHADDPTIRYFHVFLEHLDIEGKQWARFIVFILACLAGEAYEQASTNHGNPVSYALLFLFC